MCFNAGAHRYPGLRRACAPKPRLEATRPSVSLYVLLFFYIFCENSAEIPLKLLELNPDLAKQITDEALCYPRIEATDPATNISALYWLCVDPDRRALFLKLLGLNPDLVGQTTSEALDRKLPNAPGRFKNTSARDWLDSADDGRVILTRLSASTPHLLHRDLELFDTKGFIPQSQREQDAHEALASPALDSHAAASDDDAVTRPHKPRRLSSASGSAFFSCSAPPSEND